MVPSYRQTSICLCPSLLSYEFIDSNAEQSAGTDESPRPCILTPKYLEKTKNIFCTKRF